MRARRQRGKKQRAYLRVQSPPPNRQPSGLHIGTDRLLRTHPNDVYSYGCRGVLGRVQYRHELAYASHCARTQTKRMIGEEGTLVLC